MYEDKSMRKEDVAVEEGRVVDNCRKKESAMEVARRQMKWIIAKDWREDVKLCVFVQSLSVMIKGGRDL